MPPMSEGVEEFNACLDEVHVHYTDVVNFVIDKLHRDDPLIKHFIKTEVRIGSPLAEAEHRRSSRVYACVYLDVNCIHISVAILELPDEHIVGILLHEFGHLAEADDGGPSDEWDADLWVKNALGVEIFYSGPHELQTVDMIL